MNISFKKKPFPYILLAGIPLLTLIGCTSNDSTQATDDIKTTHLEAPSNISSSDITVTPSELQTETKQAENSEEFLLADNTQTNPAQESELYPIGIQVTEPEEIVIGFGFDQSEISEQYRELLKQHAEYLSSNTQLTLLVKGHTDSMGPKAYNEWLSKQRAEAVVKVLVEYGASEGQIIFSGLADDEPMTDATHNRDHRRVELNYQDQRMVKN